MRFQWTLPAEIWNHAVRALWRSRPLPGVNCHLAEFDHGTLISAAPVSPWKHPWFTTPSWNPKAETWEVTIKPGFVNAMSPVVELKSQEAGGGVVDVPLLEGPKIPVRGWMPIGNDEGGTRPLPGYFRKLGVRPDSETTSVDSASGVSVALGEEDDGQPRRYLRAVDFVLSVARAGLVGQIEVLDASGTSGVVVDYAVGFDVSNLERLGLTPRVRQELHYLPPRIPSLEERLQGLFQDPLEDTLLISTLYMLSPVGVKGEPDGRWTPYVAHNLFWHLGHGPKNEMPVQAPEPIRLITGLAAGVGDLIANQILSAFNEYADRVQTAVNNISNEGRFWTV